MFHSAPGINTVALEPPVSVTPEMYIAVRRAEGAESCGMPYGTFTRGRARVLITDADFQAGPLTSVGPADNFRLQAQASNTASVRVSTIPVVGSAAGVNGAFFRTSLTLANPASVEIRGKLRLRFAGRSGTDADPTLDYTIPANGTLSYADLLLAMNQSGLGSLDVLTTGSSAPIATARVFNDTGATGTSGFSEDAVPAGGTYYSVATVAIPADPVNFRLNVGIRTITAGDLTIDIYDAAGIRQTSFTKSYPADFFEQPTASAFVNGNTLPAGGKVVVSSFGNKEFIVYGALTDNRTNDPSLRIGSD